MKDFIFGFFAALAFGIWFSVVIVEAFPGKFEYSDSIKSILILPRVIWGVGWLWFVMAFFNYSLKSQSSSDK